MSARSGDMRVALAAHPVAWTLARLARHGGPAVRVPGVGLVINDAMVAHEVLQRDAEFVKRAPGAFSEVVTQLFGPFALTNMDGEEHRRLRGMLGDLLSPANAAHLLCGYEGRLAGLRTALERGDTIDLVRFMRIMSGRLTLEMMGVPHPSDDADEAALALIALGERVAAVLRTRRLSEGELRSCDRDIEQLVAFARAGYEADDAPPSSLVQRLRERGLSFEEARGVLLLFFVGGTLTTAAALPRIVALLVDSGQMTQVQADPKRIPQAIAEGLRFVTPLPATVRIASRDAQVGGRRIRAGERVVILTCNTARDSRLFAEPDRFDISRVHDPRTRSLWYGAGPHFCFGYALAQRELHAVLAALAAVPGTLRIVQRRAARKVLLPRLARLMVRLDGGTP